MGGVEHLNKEPRSNEILINPRHGNVNSIQKKQVEGAEQKGTLPEEDVDDGSDCGGDSDEADGVSEGDSGEVLKKIEDLDLSEKEEIGDGDGDDDDEWITAENIREVKKKLGLGVCVGDEEDLPRVACITSDFAMQNVLIQMGLKVLSMDGTCIKRARTHIFRCFACFTRTSDMSKIFCPGCGNKGTLKKVAIEVLENGEIKMFINFKKKINQRGLRYSIPHFKGGKHANNPILNEYQPRPQNKLPRKALQKMNALDPDYPAGENPFSLNDVQSRAAMLGVRQIGGVRPGLDRDPYMNRVKTGNKKRKGRQ